MISRKMIHVLALLGLLGLPFGCKKSPPASTTTTPVTRPPPTLQAPPADNVVRIHWLGKKKISADTNAAEVMRIWDSPESARLEVQTLDKLSVAPWRFVLGETNHSSTNLLRPLLDDLVEEESCIEIRRATNGANDATEMVLAIRLDDQRAGVWETNLAAVLQSLTGIQPIAAPSGRRWSLKKRHAPNLIEFARAGEWTVVGAAEDHNGLLDETLARIERERAPFPASTTNLWLEAVVDLPLAAAVVRPDRDLPAGLPKIFLTLIGENQNVRTSGRISFSGLVPMALESWNIPTNLVDGDLSSFTAVRGAARWLGGRIWYEFETNPPPNQLFLWAVGGVPMESYFAEPYFDSSNAVSKISDFVLAKASSWAATNEVARFQRAKTFNGLEWKGVPYIYPFLKSGEASSQDFILGGFFPLMATNQTPPQFLIDEIQGRTNLVYYDWELTGPRLEQWTYLAQLLRLVLGRGQFSADSVAMQFLRSMSHKLGPSSTEIVQTSDQEFSFSRSSAVGLTAIEIQLFVDWLESPEFPTGDGLVVKFHHNHNPEAN